MGFDVSIKGLKGIDVSRHQGVFPWDRIKTQIDFAIIRSSHGMNDTDEYFERNYSECKRLGIPVGAYHYFYYGDPEKHLMELYNFVKHLKGKKFELGVWIDYEERNPNSDSDLSDPEKFVTTGFALTDLYFLESAGYQAGLYTYNTYAYNEMDMSKIPEKFPIWIARYAEVNDYKGVWDMWQFTSKGSLSGYSGNLDMNVIPENKIQKIFAGYKKEESGMLTPVKEYHASTEGARPVSPNFKVYEFQCKDGTDRLLIDTYLVSVLQLYRKEVGVPVIINSAYRTPAYNEKVGGADRSMHVEGKAIDIQVSGKTPKQVYDYFDKFWQGGLGLYKTFVHIDTGNKRRWNG